MSPTLPRGIYAPLLTFYRADESVDTSAVVAHARTLVDDGVSGLVVAGSTGEFHLLDDGERRDLFAAVRGACPDVPVVAHVGAPTTRRSIALAKHAADGGAAAIMLVTPYYNRVGERELEASLRAVHEAAPGLPLLAYSMPLMAGADYGSELLVRLAGDGVLYGSKESGREQDRLLALLSAMPADFAIFVGNAALLAPGVLAGAHGGVLGLANAAPAACVAMYEAAARGDVDDAATCWEALAPLDQAIREAGPAPTGMRAAAAARLGLAAHARRPLQPVTAEALDRIEAAMREASPVTAARP